MTLWVLVALGVLAYVWLVSVAVMMRSRRRTLGEMDRIRQEFGQAIVRRIRAIADAERQR